MQRVLFISLALIAIVSATESQQTLNTILAQVNENPLGQSIGSLIQMHMNSQKSTGVLDSILEVLESIKSQHEAYIKRRDQELVDTRADCESEYARSTASISEKKAKLVDNQKELQELQAELNRISNEKESLIQSQTSTQQKLSGTQGDLELELSKYGEHHASFEEAIKACEAAIQLLNRILIGKETGQNQGAAFLQLSQKFDTVKKILEDHVKKNPDVFIQPIIDVLMELGTQTTIDLEKVKQIIQLIETLMARLKEGLHDREVSHQTIVIDLNKLIEDYKVQINTYYQRIEIIKLRIVEIQARIVSLSESIKQGEALIKLLTELQEQKKKQCETDINLLIDEKPRNQAFLEILDKLIKYFKSEVATTTTNIRDTAYEDTLSSQ